MESKICTGCKREKELNCFSKSKRFKDGRIRRCRSCVSEASKVYRNLYPEKRKQYVVNNKDILDKKRKDYYQKNKKEIYKKRNKNSLKKAMDKYLINNREKLAKKSRDYYYKNREKCIKHACTLHKNKIKNDEIFKVKEALRSRIRMFFKRINIAKSKRTNDLIGVPTIIAKLWIEKQFKKGMSWENYGEWHIDHKIPLSSAKTKNEMEQLCHYTNLQPLWARENLEKSNKIISVQTTLIL